MFGCKEDKSRPFMPNHSRSAAGARRLCPSICLLERKSNGTRLPYRMNAAMTSAATRHGRLSDQRLWPFCSVN